MSITEDNKTDAQVSLIAAFQCVCICVCVCLCQTDQSIERVRQHSQTNHSNRVQPKASCSKLESDKTNFQNEYRVQRESEHIFFRTTLISNSTQSVSPKINNKSLCEHPTFGWQSAEFINRRLWVSAPFGEANILGPG